MMCPGSHSKLMARPSLEGTEPDSGVFLMETTFLKYVKFRNS